MSTYPTRQPALAPRFPQAPVGRQTARALAPLLLGTLAAAPLQAGGGTTGTTERVSFTEGGGAVSENCHSPDISADGRYVAFVTEEPLLSEDDNGQDDVYVQDRLTGTLVCASVMFNGIYALGDARNPSISADGRCVVYESTATGTGVDINGTTDVIFIDLDEGIPRLVSVQEGTNISANGPSETPCISANGRWVAFATAGSNLLPGDANLTWDIYVRDMETDTMYRASNGLLGEPNGGSFEPAISADGKRVVYESLATNLVLWDDTSRRDVFLYDFDAGYNTLLSRSMTGDPGNSHSYDPDISASGAVAVFRSHRIRSRSGRPQRGPGHLRRQHHRDPERIPRLGVDLGRHGELLVFRPRDLTRRALRRLHE